MEPLQSSSFGVSEHEHPSLTAADFRLLISETSNVHGYTIIY